MRSAIVLGGPLMYAFCLAVFVSKQDGPDEDGPDEDGPDEDDKPTASAQGIVIGSIIGVLLWAILYAAYRFFWQR